MKTSNMADYDFYLFHQGTNYHAQELMGAHIVEENGVFGVRFTLWAPRADEVSVVGDFNAWEIGKNPMQRQKDGETWYVFIPQLPKGTVYKYAVKGKNGVVTLKADPYAFFAERPPMTASIVYEDDYQWGDKEYICQRDKVKSYNQPMLIYEVHAGSWRRTLEGNCLSYKELANQLIDYLKKMKYTHVEFLPLCEHPFDGSWGYQATGYYAPTSRYGSPADFKFFVDMAHQNGIAVIMDWVPGHFCNDEHGLRRFDGETLYEIDNPERAENLEWGTTNFDYGRREVQSFLISNALFWLEEYHLDGLRIDAVANMLYLNYAREEGKWTPNKYGGTGNLEAIDFIKNLNTAVFASHPQALMLAEESTSWPMVTKPADAGGLGFNYKWNMGWMNDMLHYVSLDPLFRKANHNKVTFSFMYAFSENFVLPLSHDEVVHGKKSLIGRMPGDYWQQFANLRVFFAYWMAHPGKKLLFMGGEFGQFIEWKYDDSLDWHLLEKYPMHSKLLSFSKELNAFYVENRPFWQEDFSWEGFEWIDCNDADNSIVSFVRQAKDTNEILLVVCNFTPEVRNCYRIGAPRRGIYVEVFNTDNELYGGSGVNNCGDIETMDIAWHGREQSIEVTVPPLGAVYLRLTKELLPLVSTVRRKNQREELGKGVIEE